MTAAAAAAGQQDVMTAGGGAGINQLLLQALTRQSQAQARTSSHHNTGKSSWVSQNSSNLYDMITMMSLSMAYQKVSPYSLTHNHLYFIYLYPWKTSNE